MEKKGKLELTWVGKYEEEKLEPRILIEDKSKSYGDPNTENMLIHGDNLLALKALENKYTGMIKCIYIDKTTPRLIQFHTLKNAVNPPFLGGFLFSGTVAA